MSSLYKRTIFKSIFDRYGIRSLNKYSKLYYSSNIVSYKKRYYYAPRYLTQSLYRTCGKYQLDSFMGDGREGFIFPSLSFEYISSSVADKAGMYRRHQYKALIRMCKAPNEKNILSMLNISQEHSTSFDRLIANYWKLTYSIDDVFNLVFKDNQPLVPFINVLSSYDARHFSTYSTLVYRWNDMNSYALEKFIKEHQESYTPFTQTTHVEYFFNCMSSLLQEAFLYYRSLDTKDVWSEVYRLSWAPQITCNYFLETPLLSNPHEAYLSSLMNSYIESKYIDSYEPRRFLDIIK